MRLLATARDCGVQIIVREGSFYRELVLARGTREQSQTRMVPTSLRSGWPCTDGFHLAPLIADKTDRILFLGCGGGLAPRQFRRAYPLAQIDVVEISERVLELAQRWFDFVPDQRLRCHVTDGRTYLESLPDGALDIVISDVWSAGDVPVRFVSKEYWSELRRVLRPGGCTVANLAGIPTAHEDPIHRVLAGAADAFGHDSVRLLGVPDPGESPSAMRLDLLRNVLLLCRKAERLPTSEALRTASDGIDLPWLIHASRIASAATIPIRKAAPISEHRDAIVLKVL
jgi:SAM-dependent methyltransferase